MDTSALTCIISIIIGVICGAISAGIMKSKGRSGGAGFAWGFLLGFIGLIIVALFPRDEEGIQLNLLEDGYHKQCPYCRKVIDKDATICPYCRSQLEIRKSHVYKQIGHE